MQYLLDTQILIWALEDSPRLKSKHRVLLENPDNTILVSQFSLMEISIKFKLGKLPQFTVDIEYITNQLLSDGFILLPILNTHIFAYQSIPLFDEHRDPVDRFLLATAFAEKIPIISVDENFSLYRTIVSVID